MDIKNLNDQSNYLINHEDDIKCSICLQYIEKNKICKKLSCGHLFHCECIDKWLSDNITCPYCRYKFISNNNNISIYYLTPSFPLQIIRISCLGIFIFYNGAYLFINGFTYGTLFGLILSTKLRNYVFR
jgi:hypothetical protein